MVPDPFARAIGWGGGPESLNNSRTSRMTKEFGLKDGWCGCFCLITSWVARSMTLGHHRNDYRRRENAL